MLIGETGAQQLPHEANSQELGVARHEVKRASKGLDDGQNDDQRGCNPWHFV
jgi:hypothetical protein